MRQLRILLLLLLAIPYAAQQPQLSSARQQQLETAVSRFMAAHGVPGLSVAVVENGRYVPERQADVVVLMNLEGGGAPDLAMELMKIVLRTSP